MGFIHEKDSDKVSELAVQMSRDLHKAVSTLRKVQYLRTEWAKDFRILLTQRDEQEVTKVLEWFCENIGKEYTPRATTARYFRMKYDAIKEAMLKDSIKTIKPTEEDTLLVAALMRDFAWPPEVRDVLPGLVAQSRVNFQQLCDAISALHTGKSDWLRFINLVLGPNLHLILRIWFEDLAHRLNYPFHAHYTGDPTKLHFDFTSERFQRSYWCEWCHAWCGNSSAFDDLLKAIIEKHHEHNKPKRGTEKEAERVRTSEPE